MLKTEKSKVTKFLQRYSLIIKNYNEKKYDIKRINEKIKS